MSESFSHLILYFMLYSAAGWLCETLYCSIPARSFVPRGFLRGPYCPVYGVGALLILPACAPLAAWPPLVFLVSLAAATLLEYFTGWLLETLFQVRWWDYSGKRFQLAGRICLKNSLLFGVLGLAVTYLLQPAFTLLLAAVPANRLRTLANGVLALFLLDLFTTIARLTGFTQRLRQLQADLQALRESGLPSGWFEAGDLEGSLARLRAMNHPEGGAWTARLESVMEKRRQGIAQLHSYKTARAGRLGEAWDAIKAGLQEKKEQLPAASLRGGAKRVRTATAAAGKATIRTLRETLSYTRLFWVFLSAGVMGYLVETLYCLVTTGVIESRQGLLYGPFNQVYGFGAVLMVLALTPLAKKNDRWVFLGGAALGGVFEVLCSLIQEAVFGSVSWQYSEERFSLAGGRTSLVFLFFWGMLGLCFIKGMYPRLLAFLERIPPRSTRVLTAVLTVLLAANMAVSTAAVLRWSGRIAGTPPETALGQYLDERYPDDFMQAVYPNMLWPEQAKSPPADG